MVTDPRGHGAKGLAIMVVVGIHDSNRLFGTHFRDELSGLDQLLARKPKVFVHHGPDGAVGVKPDIMDPSVNQLIDPGFVQEIPNVRLTHTGGHSC